MADIWILEGKNNTRKSSVARCLTGARLTDVYDVEMRVGANVHTRKILVWQSAPNEKKDVEPPNDVENELQRSGADGLLLTLRPTRRWKGINYDADAYVNHLVQQGHTLCGIVELGPTGGILLQLHAGISIPQSTSQATNITAQQIRSHWSWT